MVKDNFNIVWYVLCWNEMPILPFMIDYWKQIARKVIVIDNNSTDGTLEYLKAFDWIEVRPFPIYTNNQLNDIIHLKIKNDCWKEQKGKNVDFVIVSDLDEIIWSNNLSNHLQQIKNNNIAVLKPAGYNFISEFFPIHNNDLLLHDQIKTCYRIKMWDKCILFNPDLVEEINYLPGAHLCKPIAKNDSNMFIASNIYLFHFKYLSVEYLILKRFASKDRLSEINIKYQFGIEYQFNKQQIIDEFNKELNKCNGFTVDELLKNNTKINI